MITVHICCFLCFFVVWLTVSSQCCPQCIDSPPPTNSINSIIITGLDSKNQCQGCDPGQYCPSPGLNDTYANCTAGYYCSGNATSPAPTDGVTGNVCLIGHYCPSGTGTPVPCPYGTYTNTTQNAQCHICPAGFFCTDGVTPMPCPAGFYCPENTGFNWKPCLPGTFSADVGLSNVSQCKECTGGYYCDHHNLTTPSGACQAGYYCR